MNADDLLRRALESLDGDFPGVIEKLKREIRAYLDAPKDEPVAWYKKSLRELIESIPRRIEPLGGQRTSYVQLAEVIGWIEEYEKLHPPTKTAPKKPMTEEQLDNIVCLERVNLEIESIYKMGFRDAEKHHGIGGGE